MPRKPPPETPLYVRLPNAAVEKLDRAAAALGMHKKDLVAGLVTKYVDPDSKQGLSALGTLSMASKRLDIDEGGPMIGSYSFQPYEPPEIMNAEQAGQFLQIDEKMVIELAEAGKLPGKKLGPQWRFSRDALVAWLSTPERK
ncbi:MAG TPA: helix-turn-helix domain-containing protein [Kofleriaceae bacterium]